MALYRNQTELDGSIRHELAGYIRTDGSWEGEKHNHPFAETLYLLQGEMILTVESDTISLKTGDAVIIRSPLNHRISCSTDTTLLYLGCNYIRLGTPVLFPGQPWEKVNSPSALKHLEHIAKQYIKNDTNAGSFDISDLLHLMDPYWLSLIDRSLPESGQDILIERIKEYLALHLNEQLCVADIAKKYYISPHYLGSKFRRHTGLSIKQYHTQLRLKQARKLIRCSDLSLSEIAEQLGFHTLQYFSACFKEYYGIAPSSIHRDFRS